MADTSHEQTAFALVMGGIALLAGIVKAWPLVDALGRGVLKCWRFLLLAISGPITVAETAEQVRRIAEKQEILSGRQEKMQESLAEVRSIQIADLDLSDNGIWFADVTGRYVSANQTLCRMMGRSEDEIRGNEWMNALHPHDHDRVIREWTDAIRFGHAFRSSFRYVTPAGMPVPVSVIAAQRRHPDTDVVVGYMGRAKHLVAA